jgi:hypothetical protein
VPRIILNVVSVTDLLPRIKELLSWSGGGPTGFADAIGLPRPVMSHILAGRNKPSLEVVQKILSQFSDVNPLWLLLGEGEMLKSLDIKKTGTTPSAAPQPDAFFDESQNGAEQSANSLKPEIENTVTAPNALASSNKKIKQVLLMYEDGTFESFNSQSL